MRCSAPLPLLLVLAACGVESGAGGGGAAVEGDGGEPVEGVGELAPEPPPPEEVVLPPLPPEEATQLAQERAARARRQFDSVLTKLDTAVERYEKHEALDESRWFGEDQGSNQAAIDALLDELAGLLAGSELVDVRERIATAETEVRQLEARLVEDREAQVSAPRESELTLVERPFVDSWEDLEQRIAETRREVNVRRRTVDELEQEFVQQLRALGVEVSENSARSLLGTVSGDDFVELCAVLDNVRHVTVELQRLTEESGESLDVARRYYGCYVVLIRMLDRLQREFVRTITDEQVPRLREFASQADRNVAEAQAAIRAGGDRELLEQNVRSNLLTKEASQLYVEYLQEQAQVVAAENAALQSRLRDALNTYETVKLSSQVAELMREADRNFAALLELQVPKLRQFENRQMQAEFERLTERLGGLD